MWSASEDPTMSRQARNHQSSIIRAPLVDLVVHHELIFGLLDLHQLAKLGGLGSLALANRLGVRLEQAQDLVAIMLVATQDAGPRLGHDAAHQRQHLRDLRLGAPHNLARPLTNRDPHPIAQFPHYPLPVPPPPPPPTPH